MNMVMAPAAQQTETEALRLEVEDLRFERDRYKASAARYQEKLLQVLVEIEGAKTLRAEADSLRREVVAIARECEQKLTDVRAEIEDRWRSELVSICIELKHMLDAARGNSQ